jgi:CelD/BcsL family acetyltransferase involved in cellulose biosynthesis
LGSELGEPTDLATSDLRGLACLADTLAGCRQPLCFDRLPADSPSIAALRRASRGRAICVLRRAMPAIGIALDDSWIEPERHLSPLDRRLLERAARWAERLGPVSVQIHTPDLRALPGLLDLVLDADPVAQAHLSDDAAARRLTQAIFFRQYAEAACVAGALRICLLRIGDRIAAVQVGVETGEAFWMLKAAEDARFVRCRAGQLLARETFRYAAQANLRSCEFWGEPQAWMRSWPIVERPCIALSIYPLGIRGTAALVADAAQSLCKRLLRRASPAS